MTIRDKVAQINPEALFVDGFDQAIIGITEDMRLVYQIEKMVEILIEEMSEEDAIEYLSYNVFCAYLGDFTPIYVYNLNV